MEQYIQYSLLCDLFSRILETYLQIGKSLTMKIFSTRKILTASDGRLAHQPEPGGARLRRTLVPVAQHPGGAGPGALSGLGGRGRLPEGEADRGGAFPGKDLKNSLQIFSYEKSFRGRR